MAVEANPRGAQAEPILLAEGLSKSFGGLAAVQDLSFALWPGEILGLIGPNGAGKSTTFNLISGFLQPNKGRLVFDAKDITRKQPARISRLGLVRTFQHESMLPHMTVYENLLIGTVQSLRAGEARDARVHETARLFELEDVLDETASNLPHGRQRMLSMAIVVATRPRVLCLDEPLTGLNGAEVKRALGVIRRIRDEFGASILLVEHNMRAVMQVCDRIVVLDYGQLLAEGRPEEVSKDERVIKAYLGDSL